MCWGATHSPFHQSLFSWNSITKEFDEDVRIDLWGKVVLNGGYMGQNIPE